MRGLEHFHYHVGDAAPEDRERLPALRGMRALPPEGVDVESGFASDEAAARHHLSAIIADDSRPVVRGITAPERPEQVPDLRLVGVQDVPETEARVVRFEQMQANIPVFGGHAICELNRDRGLLSARGEVAQVEGVSPRASVAPDEALERVAKLAGVDPSELAEVDPPQLNFFRDDDGRWRLVWLFQRVPAAPPELLEETRGHGLGPSPREHDPLVDYLLDAHDGEVVFYYRVAGRAARGATRERSVATEGCSAVASSTLSTVPHNVRYGVRGSGPVLESSGRGCSG